MFNKKRVGVYAILLLFLTLSSFVFAVDSIDNEGNPIIGGGDPKQPETDYTDTVIDVTNGVTKVLSFFLEPLFGKTELISRIFMALLLGMIVYSIISNILFKKSSRLLKFGISFAITALALLGLPSGFLEAIRTQYAAMGAAILVMIPFIIVFIFSLSTDNLFISRATWVFYSIYYLAMYLYYVVQNFEKGWITSTSIPYLAGFLAGLVVFFIMPGVRGLIFRGQIDDLKEKGNRNIKKRSTLLDLEMTRLEETGTK